MSPKQTLPYGQGARVPVLTTHVEVIEGPDTGATVQAEEETLTLGTAQGNDLVLGDPTVSRFHVEIARLPRGLTVRDLGSTNGTRVGSVQLREGVVEPGAVLQLGASRIRVGEGPEEEVDLHEGDTLGGLRGSSPAMRRLMSRIEKAARTEASVLVVGESGTGKELIAEAVHTLGGRAAGPFVTVDCASMTPNLVASELFGHERGAFTGAERQRIGAFERALGGTLFLDEIGELPPELQPNLLGALERRRFRRVGGSKEIDVDVRVVAATNRDLRSEVNGGRFRLDLYYRLAVVTLQVPPLRDRPEDVELLVAHFLEEAGFRGAVGDLIEGDLLAQLRSHVWPGNVRELRNFVEATLAMGEATFSPPPEAWEPESDEGPGIPLRAALERPYREARASILERFERAYVAHRLERTGGNVAQAAREAGMDRSHLFTLVKRHELR
ncbi:MAG: sigma 54-interacting transcriptional regulator [Myxococcota bacterium]